MPLIVKVSKHGTGALRFCIPKDISTRYGWLKNNSFMVYAYDEKLFVVEPTNDLGTLSPFSTPITKTDRIYYLMPCKGYKVFSFYVPQEITEKLHLQDVKLFAVHESGDKAVFLEAYPNGTKKRQEL